MPATLADIQKKYGDSVYPLYKEQMHEPYMENDNGGYEGVVLYDDNKDLVRCDECGVWKQDLNRHLTIHKMTVEDYKEKYELLRGTPLISKRLSEIRRETALNNIKTGRVKSPTAEVQYKAALSPKRLGRTYRTQHKNKYALCEAQIEARLQVVLKQSGREELTSADVWKYDNKLRATLISRYGSLEEFCSQHKITKNQGYLDAEVIGMLRSWVLTNKKIPTQIVIRKETTLPSIHTVVKHFGSWRRAKMMAGLDQLLEEVK